MFLSHHSLRVDNLQSATEFYCDRLGLTDARVETVSDQSDTAIHAFFQFPDNGYPQQTQLELIYSELFSKAKKTARMGYWKIGITLADVDIAAQRLVELGDSVSDPAQFRDIGYLCHLQDPAGNSIELLQHSFEKNKPRKNNQETRLDDHYPLGGRAGFGQITLRVKDPAVSCAFYQDCLGMRLLSRQTVEPYGFTLYFLACCDEHPPNQDIDAVENREWLWQRPYTVLELQHVHGTEDGLAEYDTNPESGFEMITFSEVDLESALEAFRIKSTKIIQMPIDAPLFETDSMLVRDPDGYVIRLLSR